METPSRPDPSPTRRRLPGSRSPLALARIQQVGGRSRCTCPPRRLAASRRWLPASRRHSAKSQGASHLTSRRPRPTGDPTPSPAPSLQAAIRQAPRRTAAAPPCLLPAGPLASRSRRTPHLRFFVPLRGGGI
ncbi:hypothetical protein U9M48_033151 [Paspalum notatum var. saurae]|uniref:Uncharacterized protein n=1 Tax=Paspalum notatum var. saurae TaxID=547442 RepID=A0AAQ3U682_PASNO